MPSYLDAMVIIPMVGGASEDVAINTFHFRTFQSDPAHNATLLDIAAKLKAVYGTLDELYSVHTNGTSARVKIYDSLGTPPRAALYDGLLTNTWVKGTDTMPHELAIVGSFAGEPVTGIPQARRRGRIYIGPLHAQLMNPDGTIGAVARGTVNNALQYLADQGSPTTWEWCVFSRRGSKPPTPPTAVVIDRGWCDNAFDIQRRRGVDATTRESWP